MFFAPAALVGVLLCPVFASKALFNAPPRNANGVPTLNTTFAPLGSLESLSDEFTTLKHPAFPRYGVRAKRKEVCEGGVSCYAGYIDVDAHHLFFHFFESKNDPDTDDVIFWTSGAPGSSGTDKFMEHANIFFLDQPSEAGYSYADYGTYVSSTEDTARDTAALVAIFFAHFPQFQGRALHLGEAQDGRYMPALAAAVYEQNDFLVESELPPINLLSVRIGTAVIDLPEMINSWYENQCAPAFFHIESCDATEQFPRADFNAEALSLCIDSLLFPKPSAEPSGWLDLRVGGNYRLGRKLGSGSFGDIYYAIDIISGEEVAVKLERVDAKQPKLEAENKIYLTLAGGDGVPYSKWYGTEGDYRAMVLDLLGLSLEDVFNLCKRKFSLKTTLMLADQLITRIEYVHSRGLIHRDIKPANFLMGLGKQKSQVNVIDFGLSKKYRNAKTNAHIPYRDDRNLTGTSRYCSINTHIGIEQARRDDLESLGYVLMYFIRGVLPWQNLKNPKNATNQQKYDRIMEKKIATSTQVLAGDFPDEFGIYLAYTRGLRFEDEPNYGFLRKLFRDLYVREGFLDDEVYDWTGK
uniref:non-specific serine/threonine protein kinase n=1 Tax=Mycena chlorophos TaxID=658473 RepID=A0ABQ0LPL5_MYCCL|nr:predicted protein [Mycena chlorophos]